MTATKKTYDDLVAVRDAAKTKYDDEVKAETNAKNKKKTAISECKTREYLRAQNNRK